jgi:hypothetical protein
VAPALINWIVAKCVAPRPRFNTKLVFDIYFILELNEILNGECVCLYSGGGIMSSPAHNLHMQGSGLHVPLIVQVVYNRLIMDWTLFLRLHFAESNQQLHHMED